MNGIANIASELRAVTGGKVLERVLMSGYTTMKVGGPADALCVPADTDDLCKSLDFVESRRWPCFTMGAGSNLIVGDGGIEGLVILMRGTMDSIEIEGDTVRAGAGCALTKLVHEAAREGLSGLEWAAGIPGTLGGAIAGNAGAFGSDMAAVVVEAKVRIRGGSIENWNNRELGFAYRNSSITADAIALDAVLKLNRADKLEIQKRMKEIMEKRKAAQPLGEASSGSIFKNPAGSSAGRIIDELGLKGKKRGGAMLSHVHANFIVNTGKATASDVIGLIDEIRREVKSRRGVDLEPEVRIVGRETMK